MTPSTLTLASLAPERRWVGWRNEDRNGKPTKVPYDPRGRSAKANDPTTWGTAEAAGAWAARNVHGQGGGIGIELGNLDSGVILAGIDLDSCRSPDGDIEPWAAAVIADFGSYAEVSPSGTRGEGLFHLRHLSPR